MGAAGNAIVFDTDADVNSDTGSNSKSDLIRQFRGNNEVLNNDVYWHVQTGRVYQYQGTSINSTADVTFTELTRSDGGFLNFSAIQSAFASGSEMRFESDRISILAGSTVRVRLGRL
jgi:hypothetical protein